MNLNDLDLSSCFRCILPHSHQWSKTARSSIGIQVDTNVWRNMDACTGAEDSGAGGSSREEDLEGSRDRSLEAQVQLGRKAEECM